MKISKISIDAKRGCCFLIDNFAEGLKTLLCLKDNDFNKKKSDIDNSISENFYDIDEFDFLNSDQNIEHKEKKLIKIYFFHK